MKFLWLLFSMISVAHASDSYGFLPGDLKSAAGAYAGAAGLTRLTPREDFELRIWTRDYLTGSITGVIVSGGNRRTFTSVSIYRQGTVFVKAAHLVGVQPIRDLNTLKKLAEELKTFDGDFVSCGVMDGESHLVDAVVQGHTIEIQVDNPKSCTDKASQIVVGLLDGLQN
jgi:hypothetical protein